MVIEDLQRELAAERERVTNVMTLKMAEYMREVQQLRSQLAAAQAAIAKKNAYLKTAMEGATNDKLRNSAREGLAIPSDTTALTAAIAEAQQPLVDAWELCMKRLQGACLSPSVDDALSHFDAALAKVKEGKS